MIVSFDTQELHNRCCIAEIGEAVFGAVNAQRLFSIIADAEAFDNAEEFVEFHGPKVVAMEGDSLLATFGSDYAARLVPVGNRFAKDEEGHVIWGTVQRLKLVAIEGRPL